MTTNPSAERRPLTSVVADNRFMTTFADAASKKMLLTQIEEQQALLIEAEAFAQMGSWKWTGSNDQIHWSNGLYTILGKNTDDPITWSAFLEDVVPTDILLLADYLQEIRTNRSGSTICYRAVKNGSLRYFSFTTKPHALMDIDIMGAVVDITDHKENQRMLEESNLIQSRIIHELDAKEKRYRTLFERSIDPIFLTTNNFILIGANNSFLDFTGYAGIAGASVPLRAIFSSVQDYLHFEAKLKSDGQIRDFEVYLLTRTGEKKYCLLNCIFISDPIESNGLFQGIIHDLTLRKQAEYEMLVAEHLSLTGKIARTIAHEVRNPLTNINLALDQLRGEVPAENSSALLYCDIIERNANRIEELMDEMLNTSRSKKLKLELTLVSDIINDTVKMAQDRIDLNHIQLVMNICEGMPRLLVDKHKMQIAFLNIIINAIEAMTPGEGVLHIHETLYDDTITIGITDNGKGIPSSDIRRLFDPFFSGKLNGMGLGLTSTKNILNSHNAQVEVTSEIGKGTTFLIHFKLAGQ
jgi:PAS domain S-box-containing protein